MIKQNTILLLCLALLVIGGAAYLINEQNKYKISADSFTLILTVDATSSGGNRYITETLVFKDKQLVSAKYSYSFFRSSYGGFSCIFSTAQLKWIGEDGCSNIAAPPLTREAVEQKIQTGEYVSEKECHHLDVCYTLIEQ